MQIFFVCSSPWFSLLRNGSSSLYRERKFSALGRGESSRGSTALECGTGLILYIEKENFLRSDADNPPLDLALERGTGLLP